MSLLRSPRPHRWRAAILAALSAWNRHHAARIIAAVTVAWLLGATALYLSERGVNPDFASLGDVLWNV